MIPKRSITTIFAISASLLISCIGCSTSKPLVRSDYDHSVDFKGYRSFGFFEKLATEDRYESLTTQYLKAAVTREMKALGYRAQNQEPDLLVNFNIKLKDRQQVRTGGYPAGYYGYRWGYYGAWGGYNYDTYVYDYTEGTLNIDIVDRARNQMVWEGVAIGKVRQRDLQDSEQAIDSAVSLIFQEFPTQKRPAPEKQD